MSFPMLTWYQSDVLDQIPEKLGLDPTYEIATDLTFRATQSFWWRPQRDGSWICHRDGRWERGDRPASLEGVTPLPVGIAAAGFGFDDTAEPNEPDGPADALERGIARIVGLYRGGAMVSTMAELALSDRKLIAIDGSLWTVGARTGSWYRYEEAGWELADGSEESFLSGDAASTGAQTEEGPIERWAETGPLLPERITDSWEAPDPPSAMVEPLSSPQPPPPLPSKWTATHTVPPEGLQAWANPDPAGAIIATLAGRVELRIIERRADWAHVDAENGWQGWIDGRRLVAVGGSTPLPQQPITPPTPHPAFTTTAAAETSATKSISLRSVAAILVPISAFLPWFGSWFGNGSVTATDVPAAFLWSPWTDSSFPNMGTVMFVVGAAVLVTEFMAKYTRYRRITVGVAVGVVTLYLIQMFRMVLDYEGEFTTAVATMFTEALAIGPVVALAAGITLLVAKPTRPSDTAG